MRAQDKKRLLPGRRLQGFPEVDPRLYPSILHLDRLPQVPNGGPGSHCSTSADRCPAQPYTRWTWGRPAAGRRRSRYQQYPPAWAHSGLGQLRLGRAGITQCTRSSGLRFTVNIAGPNTRGVRPLMREGRRIQRANRHMRASSQKRCRPRGDCILQVVTPSHQRPRPSSIHVYGANIVARRAVFKHRGGKNPSFPGYSSRACLPIRTLLERDPTPDPSRVHPSIITRHSPLFRRVQQTIEEDPVRPGPIPVRP